MKKILLFTFFLSVNTYSRISTNLSEKPLASLLTMRGGMTGGGGDLLNPDPLTPDQIESHLRDLKSYLIAFFANLEIDYKEKSRSIYGPRRDKLLFDGDLTIVDYLRSYKIYLNKSGPCRDRDGYEVDASIYSPIENSICLSAKRLAPKLNQLNASFYLQSLIAHEFTHLVGFGEEDAKWIQLTMTSLVGNFDYRTIYQARRQVTNSALGFAEFRILGAINDIKVKSENEFCKKYTLDWFSNMFMNELNMKNELYGELHPSLLPLYCIHSRTSVFS